MESFMKGFSSTASAWCELASFHLSINQTNLKKRSASETAAERGSEELCARLKGGKISKRLIVCHLGAPDRL
jgi:hypothetical protein